MLATPEGASMPSVRLPASLLGRRRSRSEAEEARAARQSPILTAPIVAPPNTATQSLGHSGAWSPRTIMETPPEQLALQELSPPIPQIGPGIRRNSWRLLLYNPGCVLGPLFDVASSHGNIMRAMQHAGHLARCTARMSAALKIRTRDLD